MLHLMSAEMYHLNIPASLQDLLQEQTKDLNPHTSKNKTQHSPGAKTP